VLGRVGLGVLVVVVLALLGLNVLAFSGALIGEESATPQQTVPEGPTPPPPAEPEQARPREEPISRRRPARPTETARPSSTTLTLAATRGDCWVEVRAGSATGKALYSGTLASGSSLRFNQPKLWLRLGAASNVDIMVNGRPSTVPPGTVELTVPDA
jgi:hypothetical protein